MRALVLFGMVLAFLAPPVLAQLSPKPSLDDPRMQTVSYEPGETIRVVSFPDSSLKLVFHSGESIIRAVLSDSAAFSAAVVGYGDTIELVPLKADAAATLRVETNLRQYEFELGTGEGLAAAFSVRFVPGDGEETSDALSTSAPAPDALLTHYRLRGDRVLRPDRIVDDGTRTYLEWDKDKALPAVFGVGPGDDEEIVAGYMRDGVFVIDRIYPELVFRFNEEKATAERQVERN